MGSAVGNCVTNFQQSIGVGIHPVSIAYDSHVLSGNSELKVIDAATLKIIDNIGLVGTNPPGVAYDSVKNRVYVTSINSVPVFL